MNPEKSTKLKMDKTALAVVVLTIIIIGALSVYFIATYYPDIIDNLFKEDQTIEFGDFVDVHYIGRYEVNDTIFDSSYSDPENKTGGSPLKLFVTLNSSEIPPDDYNSYSPLLGDDYVIGFIEGVVGYKATEVGTIGPLNPEKAYGISPQAGDVIDLTEMAGTDYILKIIEIKENVPMPEELIQYFGGENTTLYVLREESHFVGELIDIYSDALGEPIWENATVVTKINETTLWHYTTPTEGMLENITWVFTNLEEGYMINYPTNATDVTAINKTTFTITHFPDINDTIQYFDNNYPTGISYVVESISDDTIFTYLDDGSSEENRTTREFNKSEIIQRNRTQQITTSFPQEYLEMLFSFLRTSDSDIIYSLSPRADQRVYFEVEIVNVQKPN
jgi:FKBP-type peptidyl-prolyl cis-trans isomerase 2